MQRPHVMSGGRYPVLRALAIIYVVGAALAVTVIALCYIPFSRFAWTDKLIMCVGAVAAGFFLVVGSLAIAEVLKLFIDMEHNTRMSAARTVVSVAPGSAEITTMSSGDGRTNRLDALDEETAEAALIRGH